CRSPVLPEEMHDVGKKPASEKQLVVLGGGKGWVSEQRQARARTRARAPNRGKPRPALLPGRAVVGGFQGRGDARLRPRPNGRAGSVSAKRCGRSAASDGRARKERKSRRRFQRAIGARGVALPSVNARKTPGSRRRRGCSWWHRQRSSVADG